MKKLLVLLLLVLSLSSCKIYTYPPQPEIKSVLAINSKGDTIQVSTDYLEREFRTNPGTYSNWRFQWENSWYYGYGWFNYYNPYWYNPRFYYPQRQIIIQRPRVSKPRVQSPRPSRTYVPRHFEPRTPQVQPNRGRNNVQPRVQPQQPRPTRPVTPSRNNNNNQQPTRTRGGIIIKQ